MNAMMRTLKNARSTRGLTTIELVIYIAVGSMITVALGALIVTMFQNARATSDERTQTAAVESALKEVTRAVDESASVFYATETQLGVARNVTSTSGGTDCRINQYWSQETGNTFELWEHERTVVGACSDRPAWTDVATLATTETSAMLADLTPFTLVDDTGLATAPCTATATEGDRGGDGYCVPLFRYLDTTGNEFTPNPQPAKNSISAVKMVMSVNAESNPVLVSRSKKVAPNSYTPNTVIGEVAAPQCPSTLSRSLTGSVVTLEWAPVPNATQYRVVRTFNGSTSTLATMSVAAMSNTANPSYSDNIAALSATSIVYQVVPTVGGEEADGCPQAIVSVQVEAPDVSVTVTGSNVSGWRGARSSDTAIGDAPTLRASWPAVPGAKAYESEMREMNPNGAAAPLTGWAPFSWSGSNTPSNVVAGLNVDTDTWNGSPLYSRAFQVRVRAVSDSGSSPWTFCYMKPGDGAAGTCNQFPGNSFTDSTSKNGYLVMPAPGVIEVTDVTRAGATDLTWGKSPTWSAAQYNRETNDFFRVQRDLRNGTSPGVSYAASDYPNVFTKTTATSGGSAVNSGDWANFRVLRCNYLNPFSTSGATEQCGPSSRVWSALGLPSVPDVMVTNINSDTNTNTVVWGKNGATVGATATELVDYYDVAYQQGGTGTAIDAVPNSRKASPWLNNIVGTSSPHVNRRAGDFNRYAALACNKTVNTAPTSSYLAGVTGEAGKGVGKASCSDWSNDTARAWQRTSYVQCSAVDTWQKITITGKFSDVFVSSLDTVIERRVLRYNETEGAYWSRTSSANSSANMTRTWKDDLSSGNAAEGTVKPQTAYHASVGFTTVHGTGGTELWTSTCATGTVNNPPVPQAPVVNVSLSSISSSLVTPRVSYAWNADDAPVTSGYVTRSTGSGYSSTTNSGSFVSNTSWKSTSSLYVRAAFTQRLYSWNFYASNSDSFYANPAAGGGNGCPNLEYNVATVGYWWTVSNTYWSGNGCQVNVTTGHGWTTEVKDYYRGALSTECGYLTTGGTPPYTWPPYCQAGAVTNGDFEKEVGIRTNASPYTLGGTTIGTMRFQFGTSVVNVVGVAGYYWSSGPSFTLSPGSIARYPVGVHKAAYGWCNVLAPCSS